MVVPSLLWRINRIPPVPDILPTQQFHRYTALDSTGMRDVLLGYRHEVAPEKRVDGGIAGDRFVGFTFLVAHPEVDECRERERGEG